jgi:hypothetical protein
MLSPQEEIVRAAMAAPQDGVQPIAVLAMRFHLTEIAHRDILERLLTVYQISFLKYLYETNLPYARYAHIKQILISAH